MSAVDTARQAWVPPVPLESFSLSIRRVHGKVVVTVSGEMGPSGFLVTERALNDLIQGQGNVNVEVDMRAARIDAAAWDFPPEHS